MVICGLQHTSGLSGALMTDKNEGPICHSKTKQNKRDESTEVIVNDLGFGALEVFHGFEFRCVAGHMFTEGQMHNKFDD